MVNRVKAGNFLTYSSKHSNWDDHARPPCWASLHSSLHSSFQMIVENNSAIAIDTLKDWLKDLEPVFQPMSSKTIAPCRRDF